MSRMYISRGLDITVREFIAEQVPHQNVLLVEGARQVGKSSLVREALSTCNLKSVIFSV